MIAPAPPAAEPRLREPSPDERPPWARPATEVALALGVEPGSGLDPAVAEARLGHHGPNRLAEAPRRSQVALFLDQFRNLLVAVLALAAVIAFLVSGELKDPLVIGAVVIVNAVFGWFQERRAEASLRALQDMLVPVATVRRGGVSAVVPAETLVPGDVVLLDAGARIPADGRFIAAVDLTVDESTLTGESLPVEKSTDPVRSDAPLSERRAMGFMNTTVTRGRGELLVTGIGMGTEVGHIAGMLQRAEPAPSPLQREITRLARRITAVVGVAVVTVLTVGMLQGGTFAGEIVDAVALAVAAIPEGLPVVLTLTLAVGTHQLARRRAIVKRLASVETLGCTSVICTDKTGTLTRNEMTVRTLWRAGTAVDLDDGTGPGGGLETSVLEPFVLCNDAAAGDSRVGEPTETALVAAARTAGIDVDALRSAWPRRDEIPFDSARKSMVTLHDHPGGVRLVVKGAPDVVLARCTSIATADGPRPLTDARRAEVNAVVAEFAGDGLRVLAAASRPVGPGDDASGLDALTEDLCLEGLAGLWDPPRAESADAIARCHQAGIAVKMITGDHPETARTIAAELGITGAVVTGAELDDLDDESFVARARDAGVFARVSPEHKVRLVQALQAQDAVVAMTGDGVNDAAALKTADIGIAMGVAGTEVTKEAADLVLTDDDFSTIVRAVEGGRAIYDNIVKFVRFQLATNFGAILTLLGAAVIGVPADGSALFVPLALLWVNVIMDGPPALALGVDPPAPGLMRRAPRAASEQVLGTRRLLRLLVSGLVMAVGTLGVYLAVVGGTGAADPQDQVRATVMAFTTFVLFQVFNVHNARFEHESVLGRHSLRNGKLWLSLGVIVALQVVATVVPDLQRVFTGSDLTATLAPVDWLVMTAVASTVLWADELRKLFTRSDRSVR